MTPNKHPHLRAVDQAPDAPIDITAQLRKEIEARDWSRVHVAGDRSDAVDLPWLERVRRVWR